MVSAKEAVQISSAFLEDLFPDGQDVRLEQVAPRGNEWEVVLSFKWHQSALYLGTPSREFKAIEVDRESGEPLAVKVWKV